MARTAEMNQKYKEILQRATENKINASEVEWRIIWLLSFIAEELVDLNTQITEMRMKSAA